MQLRSFPAFLAALALAGSPAIAADTRISNTPLVTSLTGTETVFLVNSAGTAYQRATTNTLAQLVSIIHWRGAYSGATAYAVGDVASYNGSSYIAIAATTGNLPTNTTYWNVLASAGTNGSGSGTVQSVTCGTGLTGGTFTITGTCALTVPVTVANGGTGATSASGTALDNITGFSSTGFLQRTGSGSYAFVASPIPVTNGGSGLTSGTSGGINCWTAATTLASSGQLGQYALMVGGGAGVCPSTLGSTGTTTTLLHGNASGPPAFATVKYADMDSGAVATASQFASNASSVLNTPNAIWSAAVPVALTYGATITPDLSTGSNFSVTLTGATSWAAPANPKPGQSGVFQITQDATGSRAATFGSAYKWAGGSACVLSTGAGKIDYVFYYVFSSSVIVANCVLDVR